MTSDWLLTIVTHARRVVSLADGAAETGSAEALARELLSLSDELLAASSRLRALVEISGDGAKFSTVMRSLRDA
jgi:hypothetical protein